ncbi:MAG: riboflavin biosynthesis protein RibF [Opitutales bacterium]
MSSKVAVTAAVSGLDVWDAGSRPVHLAIGMFDGVHRGHRRVIEAAVQGAQKSEGLACVLTFDPHPSRLFRPEDPTLLILPLAQKLERLQALGVQTTLVQPFDATFARIQAEDFASHLQTAIPGLQALYIGENFRFGARRMGDIEILKRTGEAIGLNVFAAPRLIEGEAPVSSTRVRGLLREARIEEVNTLLGYNYFAQGEVTPGKQLGRTLNFPTLNLPWAPELRPRYGVYAVTLSTCDGASQPGVANYGVRPTVDNTERPLLETHLFHGTALGPGDPIRVEWHRFIRPEQRFDSLEALKTQIAQDIAAAADALAKSV